MNALLSDGVSNPEIWKPFNGCGGLSEWNVHGANGEPCVGEQTKEGSRAPRSSVGDIASRSDDIYHNLLAL
jgi:hypothetical protein